MGKNIVICFDGTWNTADAEFPTNVVKTAQLVAPSDGKGGAQIVFYDEGVGSFRVPFATTVNRVLGGAFGAGLMDSIERAYRFLIFNYAPGDRIHVFGFSRGAFGARSFGGLLRTCGLPDKAHIRHVGEALKLYQERKASGGADAPACVKFRQDFGAACHYAVASDRDKAELAIEYLGIWDTVGALGIPNGVFFADRFNRRYEFHDPNLSTMVRHARHALAIDERRTTFAPTRWENLADLNRKAGWTPPDEAPYQQVWFPGDHASIGGGGRHNGLWQAALVWVVEGAQRCGLAIDDGMLAQYRRDIDHCAPVDSTDGKFQLSSLSFRNWREGPDGKAAQDLAGIGVDRLKAPGTKLRDGRPYRPKPLKQYVVSLGKDLGLSWD